MTAIPGHVRLGAQVTKALEKIVEDDPRVVDDTVNAIGDTTKTSPGISEGVVTQAVRAIETILKIERNKPDHSQTTLSSNIYEGWVHNSGDPETEVPRWLRGGAPYGHSSGPSERWCLSVDQLLLP